MKKRTNILIALLFISTLVFSQNGSGKLLYKVSLSKNMSKLKKDKESVKKIQKLLSQQESKTYLLSFNNNKSLFRKEEELVKENSKAKLDIVSIFAGKGKYFFNLKTKEILIEKEFSGEKFIVEDKLNYNWDLTNEERKIGNYRCYKAKTIQIVYTKRGKMKKPIVAWYCPELPISFGVKDFHGLPGATILLDEQTVIYTLLEANLNLLEEIEIKDPIKGNRITRNEYTDLVKKTVLTNRPYKLRY